MYVMKWERKLVELLWQTRRWETKHTKRHCQNVGCNDVHRVRIVGITLFGVKIYRQGDNYIHPLFGQWNLF